MRIFIQPDMTNGRTNARYEKGGTVATVPYIPTWVLRRRFVIGILLSYVTATMDAKIFSWLGREFVEICGEASSGVSVETATAELFRKFAVTLSPLGLSLDNTARIRVFGRDKQARTDATMARSKILSGNLRAASSSFISQDGFDSSAMAGLELGLQDGRVIEIPPRRLHLVSCRRHRPEAIVRLAEQGGKDGA